MTATHQHGVVARRQLLAAGFGRGAIDHRVGIRELHPVHPGVYAVGHASLSRHGRWMAAVLAGGAGAVLSHRSAAALWGLGWQGAARIDVTALGRSRKRQRGIVLHQVRVLHDEDSTKREGIPVTSVARMLFDLSEVVRPRQLRRAFEEAERLRLLDLRSLSEVCDRNFGRHALKPLRPLLADLQPVPDSRSELERVFLDFCREAGLPAPAMNTALAGFEVDASWPGHRLVVELDGYVFHRTRPAFERDRVRDAALQLAGYRVLRVTARRLASEPAAVADMIASLLGQ